MDIMTDGYFTKIAENMNLILEKILLLQVQLELNDMLDHDKLRIFATAVTTLAQAVGIW